MKNTKIDLEAFFEPIRLTHRQFELFKKQAEQRKKKQREASRRYRKKKEKQHVSKKTRT